MVNLQVKPHMVPRFVREANKFLAGESGEFVRIPVGGGATVVLTHGEYDGEISALAAQAALDHDAVVVCCFPGPVQDRHPELDVVGDWDATTVLRKIEGQIFATRGRTMEELMG